MRKTLFTLGLASAVVLSPGLSAFSATAGAETPNSNSAVVSGALIAANSSAELPDPLDLGLALSGGMLGGAIVGGAVGAGVGLVLCAPAIVPTVGLACAVTVPAGAAIGIMAGAGIGYGIGMDIGFTR